MKDSYRDIMDMPHPVSPGRPHMPLSVRAAQFAPFAALSGYGEAVEEEARLTREKAELTEEEKEKLDWQLRILAQKEGPGKISVTYFVPDAHKSGGAYVSASGFVKKIDYMRKKIFLSDGTEIPAENIQMIKEAGECLP